MARPMLSSKSERMGAYNNVTVKFRDTERENPCMECCSTPGTMLGSGEPA